VRPVFAAHTLAAFAAAATGGEALAVELEATRLLAVAAATSALLGLHGYIERESTIVSALSLTSSPSERLASPSMPHIHPLEAPPGNWNAGREI
jgi:hypothetical protein